MHEERLIISAGQCLWAAVHKSLIPALGRQKEKKNKKKHKEKKEFASRRLHRPLIPLGEGRGQWTLVSSRPT